MTILRAGLIGDHISQSRLSRGLRLMCEDHGMTLEFEMIDSAKTAGFDFADTLRTCRNAGWTGVTVTHPYKADAAAFAGGAAPDEVRLLGASNTLIFKPDLTAHNTDYTGFLSAWHHVFAGRSPGRVAMAGAGGVARALGPALARLGATDIAIWDTDMDRAQALVTRIGGPARAVPLEQAAKATAAADGLVNATPLGMTYHPGSAFDPAWIGPQSWAFDAVYTPTDTTFLKNCDAQGLAILSGFDLFRFMAMNSFEAYTGLTPDPAHTLPRLDALRPTEDNP
ncbi:MAG: shikimate dehydrogenase [Paracoccaceae bacterium]